MLKAKLRCFKCLGRMEIEEQDEEVQCPNCGANWKLIWVTPELPRIRRRIYE